MADMTLLTLSKHLSRQGKISAESLPKNLEKLKSKTFSRTFVCNDVHKGMKMKLPKRVVQLIVSTATKILTIQTFEVVF